MNPKYLVKWYKATVQVLLLLLWFITVLRDSLGLDHSNSKWYEGIEPT